MTMETNTRWLSLLSIAWLTGLTVAADDTGASKLHCKPSVTTEVGNTVILQCLAELRNNVHIKRVEWLYNDTHEVHLYWRGKNNLAGQSSKFKGRTNIFSDELSKGNCSLKLTNVNESDDGPYRSSVRIETDIYNCTMNLTVHSHEEKTSPGDQHLAISPTQKPDQNQTNCASDGFGPCFGPWFGTGFGAGFGAGFVVGFVAGICVVILCKKKSRCFLRQKCRRTEEPPNNGTNNGTDNEQEMMPLNQPEPMRQQTAASSPV